MKSLLRKGAVASRRGAFWEFGAHPLGASPRFEISSVAYSPPGRRRGPASSSHCEVVLAGQVEVLVPELWWPALVGAVAADLKQQVAGVAEA